MIRLRAIALILIILLSLVNIGSAQRKAPETPFKNADNFYNLKRYTDAGSEYQKIIDKYSDTTNVPQHQIDYNKQFILTYAYYQLGECEFNLNKYPEAIDYYIKSLANDSYHKWEEKNWYKIGMSYFYMEKYLNAIEYFKKVVSNYQQSNNAPMAQYYLAFTYELMKKPDEAKKEFERFLELYPNHEWSNKVREKIK